MNSDAVRSTLGYLGVYLAMVFLGRLTVVEDTGLALFWPAAGVAALWMLKSRSWPELGLDAGLLLLGTMALNAATGIPVGAAIVFGFANLLQGVTMRVVLAHLQGQQIGSPLTRELNTTRNLMHLLIASLAAAALSSPVGTTAAWLYSGVWSGRVELAWMVRNASSGFVVVATALALGSCMAGYWARTGEGPTSILTGDPRKHAPAELVGVVAVTAVVNIAVFAPTQLMPLTFVATAVSVWVGFRFSAAIATLHSLGVGVLVVLATLAGWGPFALLQDQLWQSVTAQVFLALNTTIVLLLSLGVAERRRMQRSLVTSQAAATTRADLIGAVTSAMSDGLLVVTASGEVTMTNPAAHALAGEGAFHGPRLDLGGLRGVDGEPIEIGDLPHARALRGESVPAIDLRYQEPLTGKEKILSVTTATMEHGEDPSAVLLLRDVTQERVRERELEAFAGVVAHDLRTPLAEMKMTLESCDAKLDEFEEDMSTLRSSLISMYGAADRMENLMLDLLGLAHAQFAPISPQEVSLDPLVDQVRRELAAGDPDRRTLIEHGPLTSVVADPTLVRQLFTNLLGNAMKYVAPGTDPHVRIDSRPVKDLVEVRISDNGIGIPRAARGRIFESFYRAASEEYAGTGLGLAICAQAVERHGGTIVALDGEDGVGTTIVFTLPAPVQRDRRTTRAEPPPRRTGSETAVS